MADANIHGVLVIDKPKGPTSHDVVQRVRRLVKSRAVGHAGTLDPMATGVLVVAIGDATKLVPWLTAADKGYLATIKLGISTATLDAEGDETGRAEIPIDVLAWGRSGGAPTERVQAAFDAERARREQVPPAFSAIKIDGVRAHELARAGEVVDLAARSVEVRRLALVAVREVDGFVEVDVEVESAKGYFVRSLARDLAGGLGTLGHLTALRRVQSGAFRIEDAVTLDAATPASLITLDDAAKKALPVTVLDADGVKAARFGQRVAPAQMKDLHEGPTAWFDEFGQLVAVGDGDKVVRGFAARALTAP